MRRALVLVALTALSTALSCGGGEGPVGSGFGGGPGLPGIGGGGGTDTVNVANNFFEPDSLSVGAGATVTWVWAPGDTLHTVTFDDGAPGSPVQSTGTFSRAFATAGSYTYFCSIHGRNVMSGVIVVQ
ncbi:MAG TPA: plastocyanin/azurin family copper-binding protein [Gemmatimonadaceae bacterium]